LVQDERIVLQFCSSAVLQSCSRAIGQSVYPVRIAVVKKEREEMKSIR
jgi:hypothetical protein